MAILSFKTKADINGNTKYLIINTVYEEYSTSCAGFGDPLATTIKAKDYKKILAEIKKTYKETDYIYYI